MIPHHRRNKGATPAGCVIGREIVELFIKFRPLAIVFHIGPARFAVTGSGCFPPVIEGQKY
jgi:hypothetical protein